MNAADIQLPARKRPVFVTILLVLFCIGVPVWLINIVGIFTAATGRVDSTILIAVVSSLVIVILRGVGMVRLFLMRADAWVPLAVAVVIDLPVKAMFLLHARAAGRDITGDLIATLVGWLIAVAIIVYAYRLFHCASQGAEVSKE